jgi:hypothetical protein
MKKQPILLALILLAALVLQLNCSATPGKRISMKQFVPLYAELIVVGQKSRDVGWDRIRSQQEADTLLAQAGVTREDFQATIEWLSADINRWKELSEGVSAHLDTTRRN